MDVAGGSKEGPVRDSDAAQVEDLTGFVQAPISPDVAEEWDGSPKNEPKCILPDIDIAELLDGCVRHEWLQKSKWVQRQAEGRSELLSSNGGPRLPQSRFAGRQWAFPCWLPLPGVERLDAIEAEVISRGREASLGLGWVRFGYVPVFLLDFREAPGRVLKPPGGVPGRS